MHIRRVKFCSPAVSVKGVIRLVVARFVKSTQVIPDLGDVGVQADGARISVQSIAVLVDLVV